MSAPAILTRSAPTTGTRLDTGSDRANARRRARRRAAAESRLRQQLEALLKAEAQASAVVDEARAACREAERNWNPDTARRPEDRYETNWDTTIDCFVAVREYERLLSASGEPYRALSAFCQANLDRDWRERTLRSVLSDHGRRIHRGGVTRVDRRG